MAQITKRKAIRQAYDLYRGSERRTLIDCYAYPSVAKQMAYNLCIETCIKYDGRKPTVLTYNSHQFTFAFIGVMYGVKCFFYITKSGIYAMEL